MTCYRKRSNLHLQHNDQIVTEAPSKAALFAVFLDEVHQPPDDSRFDRNYLQRVNNVIRKNLRICTLARIPLKPSQETPLPNILSPV